MQDVGDVLVRDLHSHGDLGSQLDLGLDLLREDVRQVRGGNVGAEPCRKETSLAVWRGGGVPG